ncbi:hypothetical protein [Oceanobacillus alkalisoli]|uniref:hypothetical protein n=1 Tax=Oceanobacillus alkalisoli TaxID=2925113 RepID=UPI001F1193C7|nr:hypothetical protein [Oceanobacillus alkalisoli]MCF3944790.1 hypothetical protein [Oceanobacillus alkalisoli]
MVKKLPMVLFTLILAIAAILIAARHPTGPNTVSYDEPFGLWLSIGMVIILFLPGLILALFKNRTANMILIVFQAFVAIVFLGMMPIGFIFQGSIGVSVIALLGTLVSIASIVIIARTGLRRVG